MGSLKEARTRLRVSLSSHWLLTVSALYFLLTPTVVVVSAGQASSQKSSSESGYSILLDAGSSSTKTKIYRWYPPTKHQVLPHLHLLQSSRTKPALATYKSDEEGLATYLRDILHKAKQKVPEYKHSSTPIFLMATAGLRFLTGSEVHSLLQRTRSVLANTSINPFLFSNTSGASVLSGEEEGVYSWIAANYLLGFFDKESSLDESVGVLEMGGGSTQITFIPTDPLYAEEFHVTLAGNTYELYVQSYLQFGINGMKIKVAQQLSQTTPGFATVGNPCMLREDSGQIELDKSLTLTMQGTGDPERCEDLLFEVLRPYIGSNCQPKPCAIGPVYQPKLPNMTFYATQAFEYAPRNLEAVGSDKILNLGKLREAAFHHCNRTLDEAARDSGMDKEFASDDCLTSLYMYTLLTKSYGFRDDTEAIRLTTEIGKQSIDWPLGAMLMELSPYILGDKSQYNVTCVSQPGSIKDKNAAAPVYSPTSTLIVFMSLSLTLQQVPSAAVSKPIDSPLRTALNYSLKILQTILLQ
ncbi:ectonucleoside triphosphate diphosphohydrolase 3 [Plakobranchus ocellatus]|uniref:Ectonucleoside triphosphate diphosphohydrolase 3 n=1 Tax=Plakobranchus ocellatus TaxID=259542 RepID=A0AAV4CS05_9GAST|nr:ectonucleoside triphosphate diphosphohydrolase 3 [Plakobranchus ocellatus]